MPRQVRITYTPLSFTAHDTGGYISQYVVRTVTHAVVVLGTGIRTGNQVLVENFVMYK